MKSQKPTSKGADSSASKYNAKCIETYFTDQNFFYLIEPPTSKDDTKKLAKNGSKTDRRSPEKTPRGVPQKNGKT